MHQRILLFAGQSVLTYSSQEGGALSSEMSEQKGTRGK